MWLGFLSVGLYLDMRDLEQPGIIRYATPSSHESNSLTQSAQAVAVAFRLLRLYDVSLRLGLSNHSGHAATMDTTGGCLWYFSGVHTGGHKFRYSQVRV